MRVEIEKELIQRASLLKRTIVFPEAGFSERIRKATCEIANRGIANVVLIGNLKEISKTIPKQTLSLLTVVDPQSTSIFEELTNKIYELRKHKGLTLQEAKTLCHDPIYFANAYVACGYADGIVCGAEVTTANTLRPALQLIKSKSGLVSSYFLFSGKNNVTSEAFLMGDCGVVEYPTPEQECAIAQNMLDQFHLLGLKTPRVAFLSYSTMGSANSESTQKVSDAFNLFKHKNPQIEAVGEVQFDACIKSDVARIKMPNTKFNCPANIFVMPNIDAGNIGYKMVQYFGGIKAIGPITAGFSKPVNDLSRGCSVEDIILLTAITCIQCGK